MYIAQRYSLEFEFKKKCENKNASAKVSTFLLKFF